jgi:hypothetical protein
MEDRPAPLTSTPRSSPTAEDVRQARQAREAAALRENLRKRRLQGQQRSTPESEPPRSAGLDEPEHEVTASTPAVAGAPGTAIRSR